MDAPFTSHPFVPAQRDGTTAEHVEGVRVGMLAGPAMLLRPTLPAAQVDRLFRGDPQLRGVVVRDGGELRLLTRMACDNLLSGPFGYGRALHQRRTLADLLRDETLVLPAELPLPLAAREMLRRPEDQRHDDLLVTVADGGVGLVQASSVFDHMARLYEQRALHDPLTGLPNRLLVEARAAELLRSVTPGSDRRPALLYVDLDHFKPINDTLGHRAGDLVLVEVAKRLRESVRGDDLVARLGGDEFAVLLAGITVAEARVLAERIVLTIGAPFLVQGSTVYTGASVGIAFAGDEGAETAVSSLEVLLRRADAAMYQAKRSGRGQVAQLDTGGSRVDTGRRAQVVRRLQVAVQSLTESKGGAHGFELHYQPKLSLPGQEMVELEALLRWDDEVLGRMSPAEFIPVAEATGLINTLGRWVLHTACSQVEQWRTAGRDLTVAVNLSAVQLESPSIVRSVQEVLESTGLPGGRLRLEITESAVIQNVDSAVQRLQQLVALGIRISLDDFGTGFSSLAMLRTLPLHEVKIDRSFVQGLGATGGGKQADITLVKLIVDAAHQLGLTVIAEGIETTEQLTTTTELGCDAGQGYLLGRPMPVSALEEQGLVPAAG